MSAAISDRWPLVGRRLQIERFDQALADPDAAGFLIHGEAGLGKTRLADECLARAETAGHPVGRVIATRTAAALPFGAIAHLLPRWRRPVQGSDPVVRFDRARQALTERVGEQRYVLLHRRHPPARPDLDHAGGAAPGGRPGVPPVHGALGGEPVPDVVTALWRDHRVLRVDLEPLMQPEVDTLLRLVLGGPIEATAAAELWAVSEGNALFLHELVMGALDAGTLVEVDGVWRLRAARPGSGPADRDRRAPRWPTSRARPVSCSTCCRCASPSRLVDAEARCGAERLEDLERSGLITVTPSAAASS